MALMKVKGNIERLFDKNLNDLVRGIRNHKDDEGKYIASCLEEMHKSRDSTADFTINCRGQVIKAHSFVLSIG